MEHEYLLSTGELFVVLFVTLGPPTRVPALFAARTRMLDPAARRRLALSVFLHTVLTAIAGGFLGTVMMRRWAVEPMTVILAAGVIFLIVSMRGVLGEYQHAPPPPAGDTAPTPFELAFPTIVTPYGLAAIIVLIANSHSRARLLTVMLMLALVLLCNLVAMLVGPRLGQRQLLPLRVFSAVFGVLTIALALQMIIVALRGLDLVPVAVAR